ncbi:MAG: dephospho-CoA kinase [Candidatus Scatosoma sp.]
MEEKRYRKTLTDAIDDCNNISVKNCGQPRKRNAAPEAAQIPPCYNKIAVTGGIGSGKSAVCSFLKEAGYSVFSCDEIYAQMLTEPDFVVALEILFPGTVSGGAVEKSVLLRRIANDKGEAELLNAFTHPKIMERLFEKMDGAAKASGASKVFAEVPLLFEGGYAKLFDKIIVVLRGEAAKVKSVTLRDGCNEETVRKKMSLQFDYSVPPVKENYPSSEKIVFVNNDGSLENLKTRVTVLAKEV